MKIFVISLERSTERRAQMMAKFNKADVEFEFFNAVDSSLLGFKLSERAANDITIKRKGYKLLDSEIGCYASHFLLWEKCVEIDEPIVIFEDHADLTDDFKITLQNTFTHISELNYIKLSIPFKLSKFIKKKVVDENHVIGRYIKPVCYNTGYMLTPCAAKKFINASEKFIEPVDDFMEKPWLHGIKTFSLNPFICYRAKIPSTIGYNRKNKNNISFYRKIYAELFRLYESIRRLR
ncbi:glycosyltransferase family 25 protein [Shewanella morhuae]|uniref:Lipooligosaccharide biosynthesis protein lex-1 n=1 Tax=Shewanella morhuae TaxID=365591 RepID=A0A380AWK7_9GAMM|nr:glycosyltransferase family 25 protein [Shewanella morhuae]SUI88749.1 Lipooligosaccharide biosynthesis protein lex-1 [Shewanella morhuae]